MICKLKAKYFSFLLLTFSSSKYILISVIGKSAVMILSKAKTSIRTCVNIGVSAAVIAACSQISIPSVVPFTMQTFAVFTVVGLIGMWQGTCAVAIYIALGALGLPVFSGFKGGIGALTGATGGYIFGFLALALIMGAMIKAKPDNIPWAFFSMAVGLFACYAFGSAWFYFFYAANDEVKSVWGILLSCVIPYLLPDAAKAALSQLIVRRCGKYIKK